jgi:transcriptional regulator with XRE-family HTH domain
MTLLERVKKLLTDKNMSFTDLAVLMDMPRPSLYVSIQSENVKYSTLKRIAEVLEVEVYNLVTSVDMQNMKFLENEIKNFLFHFQHLSRVLVQLKHNEKTVAQIEDEFDFIVRQIEVYWHDEVYSIKRLERIYYFKDTDPAIK